MMYRTLPLILFALLAGGIAVAQDREQPTRERKTVDRETAAETADAGTEAPEAATESAATEQESESGFRAIFERMRRASHLPRTAEDAREAGVEEEQVRDVIRVARERRIPADRTQEILEIETEQVRRGSDPRNFGAVVQELKAGGLRGRELAEAIHQEQIARGMKKPKHGDLPGRGHGEGEHATGDGDDDHRYDERDARGHGKGKGKGKGGHENKSGRKTRGN
jgi:hypothetical protein